MADFHAKYLCVSPEDVIIDHDYAFSINFEHQTNVYNQKSDSFQYTRPLAQFKDYCKKVLMRMKGCSYKIYFEMSPLGRMHWHGYLRIHDIHAFYTFDIQILKSYSTFVIKPITDEKWNAYVLKQQKIWSTEPLTSLFYPDTLLKKVGQKEIKVLDRNRREEQEIFAQEQPESALSAMIDCTGAPDSANPAGLGCSGSQKKRAERGARRALDLDA